MTNPEILEKLYADITEAMAKFNARAYEDTLDICQSLAANYPDRAEPLFTMGITAFAMGDEGTAIELIERAHALDPECRDYADALAFICSKVGRLADGLYFAKVAQTMTPHPHFRPFVPASLSNYYEALAQVGPSAHYLTALHLMEDRLYTRAMHEALAEVKINPNHVDAYKTLGVASMESGDPTTAKMAFQAVLSLAGEDAETLARLGEALASLGRADDALACVTRATVLGGDQAACVAPSARAVSRMAGAWPSAYRRVTAKLPISQYDFGERAEGKIRIGILAECLETPRLPMLMSLLKHVSRTSIEILVYHLHSMSDAATPAIQNLAVAVRKLHDLDPATAAMIVRNDRLDVMLDLVGYSDPAGLSLIAARVAPVQIGWLGAPEAAGQPGIDVVLGDTVTGQSDRANCLPGQEVVELACGLTVFAPMGLLPDNSILPARQNGGITFGALLGTGVFNPDTVALWAQVLRRVEGSRLLIAGSRHIDETTRALIGDQLNMFGVGRRVAIQGAEIVPEPGQSHLLALLGTVDILLDTGAMTALDVATALSMGVPVLARKDGNRRPQLVAASVLTSANRADWAAEDEASYADLAADLASDVNALAALRTDLRRTIEASPLFQPVSFCRTFELTIASILKSRGRL